MTDIDKNVSLVLGSGGARGLAHIGIIEWLCANGYRIRSIAGTSMGALIGGIYAAGKLKVFTDWVLALEKRDVLSLLDLSFRPAGLIKGDRIINVLKELIGEFRIEALEISGRASGRPLLVSDTEKMQEQIRETVMTTVESVFGQYPVPAPAG